MPDMRRPAERLAVHLAIAPPDTLSYLLSLFRDVADQHRDAPAFDAATRVWFADLGTLVDNLRDGK